MIASHERDALFPCRTDTSTFVPVYYNARVELTFEGGQPYILLGAFIFSVPAMGGVARC